MLFWTGDMICLDYIRNEDIFSTWGSTDHVDIMRKASWMVWSSTADENYTAKTGLSIEADRKPIRMNRSHF